MIRALASPSSFDPQTTGSFGEHEKSARHYAEQLWLLECAPNFPNASLSIWWRTAENMIQLCYNFRHGNNCMITTSYQGFWYFVGLWTCEFTKTHKYHKVCQKSYRILYMSVHHIWNLSWLLGLFTCHKLAKFIVKLHHCNK